MDWIKTWAISLSMVIIFGTLTESVLPNGNYRKYVHLVLGILMLISIINPIVGLFDQRLSVKLFSEDNSIYEISREKLEFKQQKDVINIFEKTLENNLVKGLETKIPELKGRLSVRVTAAESNNDFGRITHAAVIIDDLPEGVSESRVKELTAEMLGISTEDAAVVSQ